MRSESTLIDDYLDRGQSIWTYLKTRFPNRPAEYMGWKASQLRRGCEKRLREATVYRQLTPSGEPAYYRRKAA